jgi:hypothetical protein
MAQHRAEEAVAPAMTEDNPFKPPQAKLDVPRERGPVPRSVKAAALLVWSAATLGLLTNIAMWSGAVTFPGRPETMASGVISGGVMFAFMCLLGWKMREGRNWSRIIFTIIVGLGVVGVAISLGFATNFLKAMPLTLWVGSIVQTLLQLAAAVLVFTRDARAWFRD